MKLVILKNNLKSALDAASHAIGDNANLPILKNVLIKAEGGKIIFSTTNLETAIIKTVAGKIIEDGSITVPFALFNSVINNIQNERIDIENKGSAIKIKTDNYEAVIQGLNSEDYPIIPKINPQSGFIEIDGEIIKSAVEEVISAAQISELRPEISGVLFNIENNSVKLAATDTFRLAEKTIYDSQFKNNFEKGVKVIFPLKPLQEIMRVINPKSSVKFYTDGSQIMIDSDDLEIITRVIDGEFPDYTPIIPKTISTEITIDKNEIINALKLASSFTSKNNEVRLKIGSDGKTVEIYSADSLLGENKYLISAKITGKPVEVYFNWRYLLDGLKNIESETAVIGLQDKSIIKSLGDSSYFYILMPTSIS